MSAPPKPLRAVAWSGWLFVDARPEWTRTQIRNRSLELLVAEVKRRHPEASAFRRVAFRTLNRDGHDILETAEQHRLTARPPVPRGWREGVLFLDGTRWRGASTAAEGTLGLLDRMVAAPPSSMEELLAELERAAAADPETPESRAAWAAACDLRHALDLAKRGSVDEALAAVFRAGLAAAHAMPDRGGIRDLAQRGAAFADRPGRAAKVSPLVLSIHAACRDFLERNGRWPSATDLLKWGGTGGKAHFDSIPAVPVLKGTRGLFDVKAGKLMPFDTLRRHVLAARRAD